MQSNEAYRGTYSSMKPLIAAIQSNEAYRGLMQLNEAPQGRNAAHRSLQRPNAAQ